MPMSTGIVTFAFGEDPKSRINALLGRISSQQGGSIPVFTQNDIAIPDTGINVARAKQGKQDSQNTTFKN